MKYDMPQQSFKLYIPLPPECPFHYPVSVWRQTIVNPDEISVKYVPCLCVSSVSRDLLKNITHLKYREDEIPTEAYEKAFINYMKDTGG